jgi:hypothetical protein
MPDTLRSVLIFPVGFVALVILVFASARLARWSLVNAFAWLTMRPGVRYNGRRWDIVRNYVLDRDGHECQDCGASYRLLHVHHKVPVSRGGSYQTKNLETLCHRCHARRHPGNPHMWA